MAGAPDPTADWGSTGGSTTAAGSKPPGLRRSQAGHRTPQRGIVFQGNRSGTRGGVAESAGATAPSSPFFSLRQSLGHPPATGVVGRPGPACWRCGDPGHFQDWCPMMEVGALIQVPDSPGAAPDQAGQY